MCNAFDIGRLINGVIVQLFKNINPLHCYPASEITFAVIHEWIIACTTPDKLRLAVRAIFAAARLLTDTDNIVRLRTSALHSPLPRQRQLSLDYRFPPNYSAGLGFLPADLTY